MTSSASGASAYLPRARPIGRQVSHGLSEWPPAEYISVSSQADTEAADLTRERRELATQPEFERRELAGIYQARGLSKQLAAEVARDLTERDALGSHARDELGITEVATARPSKPPLHPQRPSRSEPPCRFCRSSRRRRRRDPCRCHSRPPVVLGVSRLPRRRPFARCAPCTFWGALAMAATAAIGTLFGLVI